MSNSIIDQQRDNADFSHVFCNSWSEWMDDDVRLHVLDNFRSKHQLLPDLRRVEIQGVEGLFSEVQEMFGPGYRRVSYKTCGHAEVAPRYSPDGLEGWFCNHCGVKL